MKSTFKRRPSSKWRMLALIVATSMFALLIIFRQQQQQQQIVFIMGMHHSMTSVATKLLLDTQMFYGGELEDLLIHRNNPLKYWELRKCVKANQAAFQQQQPQTKERKGLYNWIGYGFNIENDASSLQSKALGTLREMQSKAQTKPLLIKDPRLSLTIKVWLEQAQSVGLLPVCVVLVRDPIETTYRFLTDYRVLSATEWANVWEHYTFQALQVCYQLNVPVHIVHHEDYALDPVQTTNNLALELLHKPLLSTIDFPIADSWKLKHKRKQAVWSNAKPNLLLKETSLLSPQGQDLQQALASGDLHKVRNLALEWKPEWLPLAPTSKSRVFTCEIADMRNAKVLIRSIVAFDATIPLYAWGEYALVHKYELRELGWLICSQADLSCVASSITTKEALDPHSFAVQYHNSDGQFTFAQCLQSSSCEQHENLFQAYEVIGGRVSAEIV